MPARKSVRNTRCPPGCHKHSTPASAPKKAKRSSKSKPKRASAPKAKRGSAKPRSAPKRRSRRRTNTKKKSTHYSAQYAGQAAGAADSRKEMAFYYGDLAVYYARMAKLFSTDA